MALTGHILVSTKELVNQSNVVNGELKNMRDLFSDMGTLVNGTVGYWTGEASEEHRRAYTSKMTRIEEMFRRYEEQVKDLLAIAGVYDDTENKATSIADDLPPSLLD